jgi:hypothetical protein
MSHTYKMTFKDAREFQLEINKYSDTVILTLPTSDLKKLIDLFNEYDRWTNEHSE